MEEELSKYSVFDEESMLRTIHEAGIIPFFSNRIAGFSIEDKTPPTLWLSDDVLGPWDWKIFCIQSGDVAYGKFLWGGKAAFATVDVFRELMNVRRNNPKYIPDDKQQKILDYLEEYQSIGIREVRGLLGVKKSAADSIMSKLQMQTRIVTGDIARVYRGQDLHYDGWQRSSFCKPEDLFEDEALPFPGFKPRSLKSKLSAEESLDFLMATIKRSAPEAGEKDILKMLA